MSEMRGEKKKFTPVAASRKGANKNIFAGF